jgi:hypothetical protein
MHTLLYLCPCDAVSLGLPRMMRNSEAQLEAMRRAALQRDEMDARRMEDLERARADAREERAELARQHDIAMQREMYVFIAAQECGHCHSKNATLSLWIFVVTFACVVR